MKFLELLNQKPVTEIRLFDKYTHRQPSEITIKFNKIKYQIRTVLIILFSLLVSLSILKDLDKEQSESFFLIVIVVGLVLGYLIYHNLIRAINGKPVIIINDSGIIINEVHTLEWDSINSINIKEENTEESVDYKLSIESMDYRWEEDFTSFNLRMEEISHWIAYFKLKHLERKNKTGYNKPS